MFTKKVFQYDPYRPLVDQEGVWCYPGGWCCRGGGGWGSVLRGQWRIQDFAEVRAPNLRLRESHQHPILPNFGPRAGASLAPLLDPPLEVVLYRENDVFICFIYF